MATTPRKGAVLVIEDDEAVAGLVRETLEFGGHQVVTVGNGEAGVDHLREHEDDVALVLLDVTLTGLDSASTLSRLRAIRPDLAAILMSGRPEDDAANDFRVRGIPYQRYLAKPFATKALKDAVAEFVAS
jgi:DNA-binding response OmpR family regulator